MDQKGGDRGEVARGNARRCFQHGEDGNAKGSPKKKKKSTSRVQSMKGEHQWEAQGGRGN